MTTTHQDPCAAHLYHSPRPAHLDVHHVVPLAWGGANTSENEVDICATGHQNVHRLLDEFVKAGGPPPWPVLREYGPGERVLAGRAWMEYRTDPGAYHPELTS